MKKLIGVFNIVITLVFLVTIGLAVVATNNLDPATYGRLNQTHTITLIYTAFALGLIAVISNNLIFSNWGTKEIIYVDRISNANSDSSMGEGENNDMVRIINDATNEIDKISQSDMDYHAKLDKILSVICNKLNGGQGVIYKVEAEEQKKVLRHVSSYAYVYTKEESEVEVGEGLVGLAAKENRVMIIEDVPNDYLTVFSGLGKTSSVNLAIIPIVKSEDVIGVLEVALFWKPEKDIDSFLNKLSLKLGEILS